ncbi:MAG: murein transglycosylase A [Desulfobacterales bacterium]|nr:murein transglycosylase A [Desulfobacterales bacterium]
MKYRYLYGNFLFFFIASAMLIALSGCSILKSKPSISREMGLQRISSAHYPRFADDMGYADLEEGIRQSISYLKKVPPEKSFEFGQDLFDATHMIQSLEYFLNFIQTKPSIEDLNKFIESNYWVYQADGRDGSEQVLFTGYYEPILKGSLNKSEKYKFPIYARPDDLVTIDLALFSSRFKGQRLIGRYADKTVVPYYSRKEIEYGGCLEDKAGTIAWISDPVDLFFLQIQGSGKIWLDNDQVIHVHYDTTNGQPYRSIGKLLIEKGKISRSEMSMQKICAYLRSHPTEVENILNYNSSYVFFRLEKEGPLGCLGVKLIPGRSLAVDRKLFPLSTLSFIETKKPLVSKDKEIESWINFSRFVLNHDTGGAIQGPGRADLFWGHGTYAEIAAGYMQHMGKLYFLVLKPGTIYCNA